MVEFYDLLIDITRSEKTPADVVSPVPQPLGELKLKQLREFAGKSQKEVAKKIGMQQSSLSTMESQRNMKIATLQKIVAAFRRRATGSGEIPEGSRED